MQRGFKAYAEKIAIDVRAEMGIPAHGKLCAFQLTEYLGIQTLGFSKLTAGAKSTGVTDNELVALGDEVHGMCIPFRTGHAILYNDKNHSTRQQSDIAHEVSHILLRHPLADIVSGAVSKRSKELEEEAAHLGGVLLLPMPAALHILQRRLPVDVAAAEYGISSEMVNYRCNISGARQIYARGAQARR